MGGYSLWIERIANRLKFDRVSHRAFGTDAYAPYLFVLFVVVFDVPLMSTISYLLVPGRTFHPLIDLPAWPLFPLALVLGIFGMRVIRSKYVVARENAGRIEKPIQVSTPARFRIALFVTVVGVYFIYYFPNLPQVFETEGLVIGAIKYFLIIPFVYFVVLTDFVAVYVHGLYFLPIAIQNQMVPLDFSKRFGGMKPVGSLLITASVFYFVALTFWTGATILNNPILEGKTFLLHGILWGTGILLFSIALWILHRYMHEQKERKLAEIRDTIRNLGSDEEVFPYITPTRQNESIEYMVLYVNIDRVEQTQTYPVDTDRLLELIGAILIPVLLQAVSLGL